jgi:TonB dependent receptor/TonB-dependent Receptor Plug Domain
MRSYYSFSLASILAMVLASPAFAQESAPTAETVAVQEGVISYTPADFAESRPNTALDMISRIPGFSFDGGDQVRGFAGAAGNVLVDGQRPTIKTDSLDSTLSRIAIAQVERIDVIRGSAPGIDMQGQTVVANVIVKKQDTFQQVISVGGMLYAKTGDSMPTYSYQATRRVGEHQFDFNFSRGLSLDDSVGFGWRTTQDFTNNTTVFENADTEGDGLVYTARGNYKGPVLDGTLSINGLIGTDEFKNESHFISAATDERFIDRSANDRGEIGVNFKRPLGETFELEVLGLTKYAEGSLDSVGIEGADRGLFQVRAEAGESIGRGVLRYKMTPELSFEGGGEMAFNYRDQQVALVVNDVPQALNAADVRVEEVRGEAFVQSTWRISPEWSLEGGLRVEKSTIKQIGDNANERSFNYPKPRLVATWSPTNDDQLRVRIEREVGQLNFRDFSSNVDLNSDQTNTANNDLRPDKTWVYEAAFEKRFWDGAAAVLTLRHDEITDVVDVFPYEIPDPNGLPGATVFVEGAGNIGNGTNDSIALNLTLPLKGIGIPGGELKIETQWENSEVTDPTTHETRRISGQRPNDINVNFRQDLPGMNLTYGVGWFAGWSERAFFRQELQNMELRDFFYTFVEWKPDPGFSLRGELNNFDPFSFTIERQRFNGPRDTGSLREVETERRNSQVMAQIRARWTIG